MRPLLTTTESARIRRARTWVHARTQEMLSYGAFAFHRPSDYPAPLLIFGQGRTGSSLLESLLTSSGHFRSRGELLNTEHKPQVLAPHWYIEGERHRAGHQHLVCHVKPTHLRQDRTRPLDPGAFVKALGDRGWAVLHLRRRNKLNHVLSNLLANQQSIYHRFEDQSELARLTVDPEVVIDRIRTRIRYDQEEMAWLADIDCLRLVYEDHLEKSAVHQRTANTVFSFLSVEPRAVHTAHRKVNTLSIADLVENYSDLRKRLEDVGFANYLPPPRCP